MSDISHLGFDDDVAFCRWLTTEIGVAAVPPSAFYLDPARAPLLARFCFAKRAETIQLAAERLRRAAGARLGLAKHACYDDDTDGPQLRVRRSGDVHAVAATLVAEYVHLSPR